MMFHRNHAFWLLSLLFVITGCTIFSKNTSPPPIVDPVVERGRQRQKLIETGNNELKQGNLRAALAAYEAAIAIRPDASEVQYKIAEIYYQLEEYENARNAFVAFLALKPKNITALKYAGYISEKLMDYAAAAGYYERVLGVSGDNLYALNHLGLAYKQLERYDEAAGPSTKHYRLIRSVSVPKVKILHNYLGLIYLGQGKLGEAIAELRESTRLFPKDTWAREQLAALYEDQQRYFEAQLLYQQLLEIEPDNLLALTRLQALAQLNIGSGQGTDVTACHPPEAGC